MTPRRLALGSGVVLALAAFWALRPLDGESDASPSEPAGAPQVIDAATQPVFDVDAFRTPLWTAPPAPPPPSVPPAPPAPIPPSKLKLLAIITDAAGIRRATLYDPDADRVESLAPGDRLGAAVIDRVDDDTVTITDPAGTRTVRLRPDEPTAPPEQREAGSK